MKSGTCPKCQSTEILVAPKGPWPGMHQIHIDWREAALVECLICWGCGYVESYVNPGQRLRMRKKFKRYRPPKEDVGRAAPSS